MPVATEGYQVDSPLYLWASFGRAVCQVLPAWDPTKYIDVTSLEAVPYAMYDLSEPVFAAVVESLNRVEEPTRVSV